MKRRILNRMRRAALVGALGLSAGVGGCAPEPVETPAAYETGSLRARMVSTIEDDVASIRLDVFEGRERIAQRRVTPGDQRMPGQNGEGAIMQGGDVLLALRPGTYRAVATPIGPDGQPSEICGAAEATADVAAGRTSEIVLRMPCGDEGTGALDVVLGLAHPPVITELNVSESKFTEACVPVAISAPAIDADDDPLTWRWSVTGGPANARTALSGGNGAARFVAEDAGDYELTVEVSDPSGETASLSFPVYVGPNDDPDLPDACASLDEDQDGVPDLADNCPIVFNQEQGDRDADGIGDACVDGPNAPLFLDFVINGQLQPARGDIAGPNDPDRPISRLVDGFGNTMDFVDNELMVAFTDPADLDGFSARWNAELVDIITPADLGAVVGPTGDAGDAGEGDEDDPDAPNDNPNAAPAPTQLDGEALPSIALMRLNVDEAPTDRLAANIRVLDPKARGIHGVSSPGGLDLLAVAASEAADFGLQVAPNAVLEGLDVRSRDTNEAPMGDGAYSSNAFDWPYMSRGSTQDTGVAEAWRVLDVAGLDRNRVGFAVVDGGFTNHADLAPDARLLGAAFGTPNSYTCSDGGACPWHGTQVAAAGFGLADNDYGAAGSGAPVSRPILVQTPSPDVFAYLRFIVNTVPSALRSGPGIINLSASGSIPAGACVVGVCAILDLVTNLVRRAGVLVVASAGNSNSNVDSEDCIWFFGERCWEGSVTVPCELDDVICVGGLAWDSTSKHPSSSYGVKNNSNSVDIFGPFQTWTVTPNADGTGPANTATLSSGTSFSAPFVAGCAALIWAADPTQSVHQVTRRLTDFAHAGRSFGVRRMLNCYDAVVDAMGGDAPLFLDLVSPVDGSSFEAGRISVPFRAIATDDEDGTPVFIQWRSDRDGILATNRTSFGTPRLSRGRHVVTVRACDSAGWCLEDSATVDITDAAPEVSILAPGDGARFNIDDEINLSGRSIDFTFASFTLPEANVTWYVDDDPAPIGVGHAVAVSARDLGLGAHTIRLVGSDGALEDEATVDIIIEEPVGDAPPTRVRILTPALDDIIYTDSSDARGPYAVVELTAEAFDVEDGGLSGAALQWTTRMNGGAVENLGSGSRLFARLYMPDIATDGVHAITLTATDSAGNSRSATTSVRITTLR
ncbi:MAG: S8 family peptidase [Planctomycetota bacterium]|jgi:hypothetical protein